jgi:hypothetical protein
MVTYTVTADNCEAIRVTTEVKGLPMHSALFAFEQLVQGFRDVRIIREDTGEVMKSVYYDGEKIKPNCSESTSIDMIKALFD